MTVTKLAQPEVVRSARDYSPREMPSQTPDQVALSDAVTLHDRNGRDVLRASVVGRGVPFSTVRQDTAPPDRSSGMPMVSGQIRIFQQLYGAGLLIDPPYNPEYLAKLPHFSSILGQCQRAIAQGIHGHGFGFTSTFDAREKEGQVAFLAEAEGEKERAKSFFNDASLDYSFIELALRTRLDLASVGWSGWEFIRDMTSGRLVGFEHAPGVTLRLGVTDTHPTLIYRIVMNQDGSGWRRVPAWKHLRRYIQVMGGKLAFFKQPGDPRAIDKATGSVLRATMNTEDYRDPSLARELLWFSEYDSSSPDGYGVPDWIGTLVDIAGERAAAEVNWSYFTNKSVPPLAILVQGGALTQESHERIAEKLDELKGVENWHKVLILEATTDATGSVKDLLDPAAATTPRVSVEKLTDAQHGDALFQNYTKQSRDKVRSATGVPPVLIGESSDYNRATAQVAMEVFEQWTAAPKRNAFDDRVNRFVMPEVGTLWWKFRSNPPNLSNVDDIMKAIETGVKAGVGSPNLYGEVLEQVLNVDIANIDQAWANFPIDLTKQAMASGLVSINMEEGTIGVELNEEHREKFKDMVGQMLESAIDRTLLKARAMAAKAE